MVVLYGFIGSIISYLLIEIVQSRISGQYVTKYVLSKAKETFRPDSLKIALRDDYKTGVHYLVDWLDEDQDKEGPFAGQFGRSVNPDEKRYFQSDEKDLSVKPRMYLTGWPSFILSKNDLAPHLLKNARQGVSSLLTDGVVKVPEGALPNMSPNETPLLVSYRHTIRAIHILLVLGVGIEALSGTLGKILDTRYDWQNNDGGWSQCNRVITNSDIMASSYACHLFDYLVTKRGNDLNESQIGNINDRIYRTIKYMIEQWEEYKWGNEEISGAKSAPMIAHEVGSCMSLHSPEFYDSVLECLSRWLTPTNTLSDEYVEKCEDVNLSSLYSRMAYVFFMHNKEDINTWKPLFSNAIDHFENGNGMNSADVSFMVDMLTYAEEKSVDIPKI